MKKIIVMLLVLAMVLSLAACGKKEEPSGGDNTAAPTTAGSTTETSTPAPAATDEPAKPDTTPADDPSKKGEGVMTYAEYAAAALDTQVVVETYVQAKQSWWDNKATVYTQDADGAYFLYSMACSQEDFDKLVPGTKIKVTGYKSEWSGEVEITDATFEIEEGSFIAAPVDVTSALGTDALIDSQNMFVAFKNLKIEAQADGSAYLYSWDGSGSHDSNSDLYFNVSVGGNTYSFTVESYLCDNTTDVYKAVENLKVGDIIDAEGFLYWYNGVNPHITKITVTGHDDSAAASTGKSEGVMTYAEYAAAEFDTPVVVETYVQAKQSWWDNKATVYTQDEDGAYFLYSMACSQEDFEKLVPGTKIKVTGYKSQWSGEVEITDATFEIEEGSFIAAPVDVTAELGTDALIEKQNQLVVFKDLTVEAQADGSAFLYNWDGSGSHDSNSDLYFNVSVNGQTYTFTVESYLTGNDTEVYKAVESLKVGDKIDAEGFLYWYNGVNPHITKITNK